MEIRYKSSLFNMVAAENEHPIKEDSPELIFMKAAAAGDTESVLNLFEEEKLFGGKTTVDMPYDRFEGLDGIRRFCETFLQVFHADSAEIHPVIQTRANGRCVTEMVIDFVVDGMINQVPMFVVGDLRTQTTLDEIRCYTNFSYVPGQTPYRKPIFESSHMEAGEPNTLTGSVREYYEALHHMPAVDVDRILKTMNPYCTFGGYEMQGTVPEDKEQIHVLREAYEHMTGYIPRWITMRYETLIDDGVNAIIEWQHVVSDDGRKEGARVSISAISAYERGKNGLLSSIRICDYAGHEREIDWTKTPWSREKAYAFNNIDVTTGKVGDRVL